MLNLNFRFIIRGFFIKQNIFGIKFGLGVMAILTGTVACSSGPKKALFPPREQSSRPVDYQKEKSHFMNINPSIVVGHFKLKDRYCTDSTYWYSNLLDYTRTRNQSNALSGPALGEELTLNADQTYAFSAGAAGAVTGSYSLLEQGPTRIVAITKSPGEPKGASDSQAHHRIEITLKGKDAQNSRTVAIDLVNSSHDQLVLVEEVPRAACESGDSLNLVYERVKP